MENRLLISFSGGETSALMTWWCLRNLRDEYDAIVVVFANTGQENEETLEFVRDCDDHFGFETVWIEGVQHHNQRKSPTHRVVSFDTAWRETGDPEDGIGPFEDHIRKYGIPNYKFKDCTRSLKRRPIESYARSIGWEPGTYDLAIGIRADEIDRMSSERGERRIVYPLVQRFPMTKPKVNAWWSEQPFRLRLKGYQGNCKWCWKKSLRKHLTLIQDTPEVFDFPRKMEERYGTVGPEFKKDPATRRDPLPPGYRRTFFRGNRSVSDLFAEYDRRKNSFEPAEDDAQVLDFDMDLDMANGCEESCEVFSDEDEASVECAPYREVDDAETG